MKCRICTGTADVAIRATAEPLTDAGALLLKDKSGTPEVAYYCGDCVHSYFPAFQGEPLGALPGARGSS
jgi:hypothetical protein